MKRCKFPIFTDYFEPRKATGSRVAELHVLETPAALSLGCRLKGLNAECSCITGFPEVCLRSVGNFVAVRTSVRNAEYGVCLDNMARSAGVAACDTLKRGWLTTAIRVVLAPLRCDFPGAATQPNRA